MDSHPVNVQYTHWCYQRECSKTVTEKKTPLHTKHLHAYEWAVSDVVRCLITIIKMKIMIMIIIIINIVITSISQFTTRLAAQ